MENNAGRDTLRRPVVVVKKRSGPLEDVLAELSQAEEAERNLNAQKNSSTSKPAIQPVSQKRKPTIKEKEKEKKRERWLLTRKTWKYMTDAGRKLISDGIQNSKEDIPKIEAYFNNLCEKEHSYILWRRKQSYPSGLTKRHLKKLPRHSRSFKCPSTKDDTNTASEIIELLQTYLKLDGNYKTSTLLGSKTVRPDQTLSPSARRPVKSPPDGQNKLTNGSRELKTQNPDDNETMNKQWVFERLCKLGENNSILRGILSSEKITSKIMDDKDSLKKLYIALKKQQMHLMLDTHSQSQLNLKHSLSLTNLENVDLFKIGTSSIKSTDKVHNTSKFNSTNISPENEYTTTTKKRNNPSVRRKNSFGIFKEKSNTPTKTHKSLQPAYKRQFNTSGTQTNFIPLQEIRALAEEYKIRKKEESGDFGDSQTVEPVNINHRKSSIDNEDVSQSVSDTIKRYLRMARKKSVNGDNANRFKRVNYDRNLRNIRAKGEINPPGMDEGNNKAVQTLDAWPLIQLEFIRGIENSNLLETAHSDWEKQLSERIQKQQQYEQSIKSGENKTMPNSTNIYTQNFDKQSTVGTPCSLPTSPTSSSSSSYHHTYVGMPDRSETSISKNKSQAKSLESIVPSKKDEERPQVYLGNVVLHIPGGKDSSSDKISTNMQKSKSSSNVGLYVTRKFTKRRSKSQTRTDGTHSDWSPSDNCTWISAEGAKIVLEDTILFLLSDVETRILKSIALQKINELNVGLNLKAENFNKTQNRMTFLKKRSGNSSFFDIGTKDECASPTTQTFGISLERCLLNAGNELMSSGSTSERGSLNSISSFFSVSKHSNDKGNKTHERSVESLPSNFTTNNLDSYENASQQATTQGERDKPLQVPRFVCCCLEYLEAYGLDKVGLFRVSTSKKRVRELRDKIDLDAKYEFETGICAHDVATLFKEFLRDLPEPLLTHKLYKPFLETQRIRNRRLQLETISHLIKLLPSTYRDTLYVILRFLAKVAARADDIQSEDGNIEISGNKMDSYNLATVFAPNILRSSSKTSKSSQSSEQDTMLCAINIFRIMIDHYGELFTVPAELVHHVYSVLLDDYPEVLSQLCYERCTNVSPEEHRHSSDDEKIQTDTLKLYTRESILHNHDASSYLNDVNSSTGKDRVKAVHHK